MGRKPMLKPVSAPHKVPDSAEDALAALLAQRRIRSPTEDPGRIRSMSVKLDADRFRRVSRARYELDMSAQDIFIEALDLWFKARKI